MTDITENESRMTAYTRIESKLNQIAANQERLDKHMREIILDYRQMAQGDRAAAAAQFPDAQGGDRFAASGGGQAGAALAAGNVDARHGRTGPLRFLPGYISESFL
ncbi:MAG: hypothetical protein KDD92_00175 [Caldilineaceae bacterium]|nr:hypothetical protein [Caldilineaceae bacterium]